MTRTRSAPHPRGFGPSGLPGKIALSALLALSIAAPAIAQQQPLTGRMLSVPAPQPPASLPVVDAQAQVSAPPAVPPAAPPSSRLASGVGDVTRSLFALQADPHRPGTQRPVTGEQASAAYRRYLRSFEHDIPETFETNVGSQPARQR